MTEEERKGLEDLQKQVGMLHEQQKDLERQAIVFSSNLAEQSKRISESYEIIDKKLDENGD